MNQREFDNVRLLADIKPSMSNCIAIQLADEFRSSTILNLKVHNLRSLFMCGVAAIPIYLPLKSDLTTKNSKDFVKRLNRLLSLFESLVHRDILSEEHLCMSDGRTGQCMSQEVEMDTDDTQRLPSKAPQVPKLQLGLQSQASSTHMTSGYPKLVALSKKISQDPKGGSAYSKFLRLPSTAEEAEEANQIVTEFNDNNDLQTIWADQNPNHPPSESRVKPPSTESKSTISSQKCLTGLWKALAESMRTSECKSTHLAKIQIRHPGENALEADGIEHNIFLSCCLIQDKWQETTCGVISRLHNPPKLQAVKDICKIIHGSLKDAITLKIMIHDGGIFRDLAAARCIGVPQVLPTLSLDTVLRDDSHSLSPYHKITLALNLSHSLSQLHLGGMSTEWTSQDILFLFNQRDCAINQAYNPYVSYSLSQQMHHGHSDLACTRKFSLLIAFGKLLIEIALGRVLEDSKLSPHPRVDIALLTIIDDPEEGITENVPSGYVGAIEACLLANLDDGYDNEFDEVEELDEESQIRGVLATITESLESSRIDFLGDRRRKKPEFDNPNFPKELNVSRSVLRQTTSRGSIEPRILRHATPSVATEITNDGSTESVSQLFDGKQYSTKSTDEKAVLAQNFMRLVNDFRETHIETLETNRRIRIAILDTGVDCFNPFIRGVCKTMQRHKRHSPLREVKSFLDGGTGVDTYGHGTNVAALVLKVAPEADLYIAQIAQSKEETRTEHIVEAINWARHSRVDIISMSFGMSEDCYEINKAIGQAEHEDIIIFAAASNSGGNLPRAFPARMDKVICIHSSDGDGEPSGFNPSPKPGSENFTTLGEGIQSVWEDEVYLRGTSYATPIAAGFAASVLQYIQNSPLLSPTHRQKAFTRVGMLAIMAAMSERRVGFSYVTPWRNIWALAKGESRDFIAFRISEALKYDR